jgi:hypothetical protein
MVVAAAWPWLPLSPPYPAVKAPLFLAVRSERRVILVRENGDGGGRREGDQLSSAQLSSAGNTLIDLLCLAVFAA